MILKVNHIKCWKPDAGDATGEMLMANVKQRREKEHRRTAPAAATHRRLIPDSGGAEEREGALSSGEGEGLGVTASFSVSSLQTQTSRRVSIPSSGAHLRPTRTHLL